MNLVRLDNLTHHYSDRILFDSVNLLINAGDRIGLIGRNGSGKTTLLRLIAGLESPAEGAVTVWGGVRIQYLPQEPDLPLETAVLDYIFQGDAPQLQLLRQYEAISEALQATPNDAALQAQFAQITQEMDRTQSWQAEAEAKAVLTRLGITGFQATIGTLSGGQQKRVALARGLIDPGDLLILDEPTNHIDAETISWLEQFLLNMPAALLMVTHDRYFLDRVVNKIVELDRRELVTYGGNYGRYLQQRATREDQLQTAETKRQALLRQELAWLHRGAQSRTTKQKARIQRVEELQTISYDKGDQRVALALASRRLGKRVLEASNLSKSYGDLTLFKNLDLQLDPGDRIGIIGPNGAGKSTLLDVLAGKTAPDSGEVRWGDTVELGYYDQQAEELADEETLFDYMNNLAPLIRTNDGERVEAAQMLEWFLFTRPEQRAKIGSLSGGERRRLYLLRTLVRQPNVLFLDEPTNDLDVQTLTVLEQFLDQFSGTLVVVSHDRYFLDRNVDFLLSFEDGVLGTRYPAPYETYQRLREEEATPAPKPTSNKLTTNKPATTTSSRPRKLTWKEQRELETAESTIETLTEKIATLSAQINEIGSDYERLQPLVDELEQAKEALETAEFRWLELTEISENS
ncbi:MAG: ABC-F family ATP-binding cassette domain-containing protein [Ardenticatenaceae bacterium]|nr:ABC-F family ATP-binding cassette domain-containing protein [Anaerolineales bacterium]MCB8940525.1 ABC-F family ATP-binding cassette domain-containing protein [Ardenticatenaceae bacterium]MCB8973546.1 ABC-F family ATP-binding cassette domain-containing protein [Ardenticatenaceae bacterium]